MTASKPEAGRRTVIGNISRYPLKKWPRNGKEEYFFIQKQKRKNRATCYSYAVFKWCPGADLNCKPID